MSNYNAEHASVFTEAVAWVERLVVGSIATSVAVLAIATLGALLLTGRSDWRQAFRTIVGCFIVFGASGIVGGLLGTNSSGAESVSITPPPPVTSEPRVSGRPYDPYAGAALIRRPLSKEELRSRPLDPPPDVSNLPTVK